MKIITIIQSIFTIITVLIVTIAASAQPKQTASFSTAPVPKEYVGHWQKGVFSLSSFEQHDGKYVGPANETSQSYVINGDGTAQEYFIANTNSYNCRLQVLGLRKGKIIFNTPDNSFEFRADNGYYTSISCFSKTPTKKPYSDKDLYPAYTARGSFKKNEKGEMLLVTKRNDGSEGLVLNRMN